MPCAVDHNLLLDIVLTHRFHRTVLRGRRVRALGEIGTVLRVNGILVAGRNANWMDRSCGKLFELFVYSIILYK